MVRLAVLSSTAAALLLAAGPLAASADAFAVPVAKIEGSNGYKVIVEGFEDQITVTAKSEAAGATYGVTGIVEPDLLVGDLGPFGSVSLQFVPAGPAERIGPSGCRAGVLLQEGLWYGTLSFVAEREFASAFAGTLDGEILRLRSRCRDAGAGPPGAIAALHARDRGERGAVFTAFELGRRKSFVSASRAHTEEGVRVVDFARDRAGPASVRIDRERGRAWISPHPPFTGHARFRRGAGDRQRWRGNLAVQFPSGDVVRLAGPRFNALLGGLEIALGAASFEGLLGASF